MIIVTTGTTNNILFTSRFLNIDKIEIIDHNTKDVETIYISLTGDTGGKIYLTGLTYSFLKNNTYTFKAYSRYDNNYYLGNYSLIRTWLNDERVDNYVKYDKTNTYKVYKK